MGAEAVWRRKRTAEEEEERFRVKSRTWVLLLHPNLANQLPHIPSIKGEEESVA